jgi:hypothetical protein
MCELRPFLECVALVIGLHIVGVSLFLVWAVFSVMWGP